MTAHDSLNPFDGSMLPTYGVKAQFRKNGLVQIAWFPDQNPGRPISYAIFGESTQGGVWSILLSNRRGEAAVLSTFGKFKREPGLLRFLMRFLGRVFGLKKSGRPTLRHRINACRVGFLYPR